MIGWPFAFVIVFMIVTVATLTAQFMAQRHEYRMERLEQDGQIVKQVED